MFDIVNGIVIGEIEIREYYRFYSKDNKLIWDAGRFENDKEAENAFWDKFKIDPYLFNKYKKEGVEMRAWKP